MQVRLWKKHPDACCYLNKVLVLESLKPNYRVWVSGLRGHQSAHRSSLRFFGKSGGRHSLLKCCPLLDLSEAEAEQHVLQYGLPPHPLACQGYGSISCLHCTAKGSGRSGRWAGQEKTECGLHVEDKMGN
jgi:phosphoadenosine phosphosulfate reductase